MSSKFSLRCGLLVVFVPFSVWFALVDSVPVDFHEMGNSTLQDSSISVLSQYIMHLVCIFLFFIIVYTLKKV
jgi:hypothetical protein